MGNVSLVERPLRISTLVSQVRSALRAREHQYQVRDLLAGEQAARIEADVANRAKDHFLAALSHELRTPLSPVVMGIAAMEKDPRLPPPMRSDVSMMRRNIDLEVKLIDDLLDMSQAGSPPASYGFTWHRSASMTSSAMSSKSARTTWNRST